MSEYKIEKRKLISLISEINSGEIQLPKFQRDYKWKPSAVMMLIDSINKMHPAGTLLFLEIEKETPLIEYEKVRSVTKKELNKAENLILDGQQRLTSMHSALTNKGVKSYFFDLVALMNNYHKGIDELDLIDDKILIIKKHVDTPDGYLFTENLLPLSYLIDVENPEDSKLRLKENLMTYKRNLIKDESNEKLLNFVEVQLEVFLDSFYNYEFPTVILSKKLDITGVCKVFQTINTTGLKLSAFDICVATFMPKNIDLKKDIKAARDKNNDIYALLSEDETIILQVIALVSNKSPKKNNLPNTLKESDIRRKWDIAVNALDTTVKLLDNIGVGLSTGTKLLPYQPMVPVIAAAIAESDYDNLPVNKQGVIQSKIKKWFYNVSLSLRYTEGTDNKMSEDFKKLVDWFALDITPDYVDGGISWNVSRIIKANKTGAFGKAILVAINANNPVDFHTTYSVGYGKNINPCHQHHIFPRNQYKSKYEEIINSVFNFTFLTSESNQHIKDRRTSDYISDISEQKGAIPFQALLYNHFIDKSCYNALVSESFDDFLKLRSDLVLQYFKDSVGLIVHVVDAPSDDGLEEDIDDNFIGDTEE